MRDHLSFMVPNHKADEKLGANSRANWRVKHRLLSADKHMAWQLTLGCLTSQGMAPDDFLCGDKKYRLPEEVFPVLIHFKRFYSGKAQQWDDDNLASAYKGFRDGIAIGLDLNDKLFRGKIEQARVDKDNWLEVYIYPAWASKRH
jgi:hypothetical protein